MDSSLNKTEHAASTHITNGFSGSLFPSISSPHFSSATTPTTPHHQSQTPNPVLFPLVPSSNPPTLQVTNRVQTLQHFQFQIDTLCIFLILFMTHFVAGVLNDLKVFIYDLPSKYNTDWLANERCRTHLFASEVAIHRALLTSNVRTLDPHEADFFFVPVYVSCNFSTVNGFPAIGHARSLISSAVQLISGEHPFWNRSRGSDHVFVASHDFGACFHTMVRQSNTTQNSHFSSELFVLIFFPSVALFFVL